MRVRFSTGCNCNYPNPSTCWRLFELFLQRDTLHTLRSFLMTSFWFFSNQRRNLNHQFVGDCLNSFFNAIRYVHSWWSLFGLFQTNDKIVFLWHTTITLSTTPATYILSIIPTLVHKIATNTLLTNCLIAKIFFLFFADTTNTLSTTNINNNFISENRNKR